MKFLFKQILISFLSLSLVFTSCSGKSGLSSYNSSEIQYPQGFERFQSMDKTSDREFKIKDPSREKDSLSDKAGFVILGLALAGITASAIIIPYVMLNK